MSSKYYYCTFHPKNQPSGSMKGPEAVKHVQTCDLAKNKLMFSKHFGEIMNSEDLPKNLDLLINEGILKITTIPPSTIIFNPGFKLYEQEHNWSLTFGTAGVRVRMGEGLDKLNDDTILMLSMGFAQHLLDERKKRDEDKDHMLSIVIGYDGRHNSKRFAQLSANVFMRAGIQVHLFDCCVPTPVVSFAIPELKCDAGLMITASHNPKEDNGYKAYWSNGAQILAPHDKEICRIAANSKPTDAQKDLTELERYTILTSANAVLDKYYAKEAALCCYFPLKTNFECIFTYSAFHGVGSPFVRKMFSQFGFRTDQLIHVTEQDEPNPDFPTVPFPNPEEGHRVLDLCFRTADSAKSNLILANDPDADRLQLAEKQSDGKWRIFTGNEMGALLTWWIWTNWRQRNPNADLANVFVLNSAVSSQIVATMAKHEGFQHRVALTGFKWIGNLADELRAQGKTVILSWEESIGFTPGSTRDKDGISSAAVFAEMAQWLYQNQKCTLQQQLFQIYRKYGFHLCQNSYWIVPGPETTRKIFAELRENGKYPEAIGQSGRVKFVRDLTTGFDSSQPDSRAILPLSTSSEMVTFTLDTGSIITLRASGTEPKIKYYIELRTEPGKTENDLAEVNAQMAKLEQDVVDTLLQPKKFGLKPRAN